MRLLGILETCICSPDLEAAERFYTTVFGLEVISRVRGRHVFFRCGQGVFLVFDPKQTSTAITTVAGTPIPLHGTQGAGHTAFAIKEAELDAWRARLDQLGVPIEVEIAWPEGCHSIYVRDPAGNSIELATPRLWGLPEISSTRAEPHS